MPNTLAHLGIQGLITRAFIRKADLKWVYLGCVIPDLPWIFQRIARAMMPDISLYDLRLYVVIGSSLLFSIILSSGVASLSRNFGKTFLILSLGSFLHLLLDALQTKWGNGVHLFAPVNWEMVNFGLFWPENLTTYLITASGLVYFIARFKEIRRSENDLILKDIRRWLLFVLLIAMYLILPLFMLHQPLKADSHYIKTLRDIEQRQGRYFEIDRRPYRFQNGEGVVTTFANEEIRVRGIDLKQPATVSAKARFVDRQTAVVIDYYEHFPGLRDLASYLGLGMVVVFWALSVHRGRENRLPHEA